MAFQKQYFYKSSAGFGRSRVNQYHTYKTDTDAIATVKASGYFDESEPGLQVDDLIYVSATDDRELLYVASLDPVVTADIVAGSTAIIPDGSITHAKLAADCVELSNMADNSVDSTNLTVNAVNAGSIQDGSITNAKLLDSAITSHKLNTGSIGYLAYKGSATATATTSQVITVTGSSVGDVAYATMTAGFSVPINGAVAGENIVTVYYDGAGAATSDTVEVVVFIGGTAI